MNTVISVENLSKTYRLGQIGTGTFTHDLSVWLAKARGRPNPLLKIGQADHGNRNDEELMALRNVSFTVQQGEVLGIIGKNGAGKSTLLKILSRVTAPTSGKIKVKGRVASLLEVGTGFHPELTGRENIYLNGAILGMTRQEVFRKFDEIVGFAEVEKFIDTPVKRYSSGMYVRLAFAVAAHLEPEILVVDEVLAVGDAEFQKKCLGKMGEVAKEGRTVLFVSHNMNAVSDLTNRSIWLQTGELRLDDLTDMVVKKYLSQGFDDTDYRGYVNIGKNKNTEGGVEKRAFFVFGHLMNKDYSDTTLFVEGEPILLRVGIRINGSIDNLQFGCGVVSQDKNFELFTVPASISQRFLSGQYDAELLISPNHLREGSYFINLKLLANGIRQETIRNVLPFTISGKEKKTDNSLYERWINGPLCMGYEWGVLTPSVERKPND